MKKAQLILTFVIAVIVPIFALYSLTFAVYSLNYFEYFSGNEIFRKILCMIIYLISFLALAGVLVLFVFKLIGKNKVKDLEILPLFVMTAEFFLLSVVWLFDEHPWTVYWVIFSFTLVMLPIMIVGYLIKNNLAKNILYFVTLLIELVFNFVLLGMDYPLYNIFQYILLFIMIFVLSAYFVLSIVSNKVNNKES